MANFILVSILGFLFSLSLWAKVDALAPHLYLGEKNLEGYHDRYDPWVVKNPYQGDLNFKDGLFWQDFFQVYLFPPEKEMLPFLRSELNAGQSCSNEKLSEHFDKIRYSYRLISLSYLLEGQWHLKLLSDHMKLKKGCGFNLDVWLKTCHPRSTEMTKLIARLREFQPRYQESLPKGYGQQEWWKEFEAGKFTWFSHYRLKKECGSRCESHELETNIRQACQSDQELMTLICSEQDEIYGLSTNRKAYSLLGLSNIINTYNNEGEALGCLRRFSQVMSSREVRYLVLSELFPPLEAFLKEKYQERFLQGRIFFYGSSQEYENAGLKNLYVHDQPFKMAEENKANDSSKETSSPPPVVSQISIKPIQTTKPAEVVKASSVPVPVKRKSAFLLASELRDSQDLQRIEVDMQELKYDYVFSLNMINNLSVKLKTFMTREALKEMMEFDELGSKKGPVPLLFLKYMIDMEEHQGIYNLLSVLGDKFYVSNEIDETFPTKPELIHLLNDESTGRQWQLVILKTNWP